MKYMINFQIVVFFKGSKRDLFRTSYTIKEITKVELKVGRITNGLSGEYQTY